RVDGGRILELEVLLDQHPGLVVERGRLLVGQAEVDVLGVVVEGGERRGQVHIDGGGERAFVGGTGEEALERAVDQRALGGGGRRRFGQAVDGREAEGERAVGEGRDLGGGQRVRQRQGHGPTLNRGCDKERGPVRAPWRRAPLTAERGRRARR